MMRLSLMREVFKTVNEDWDCPFASALVKTWNNDRGRVKMYRASANFICFMWDKDTEYVARFNSSTEKKLSRLEGEIALINYLAEKKIPVARPVPSNSNKFIEEACTEYGTFFMSVFEKVHGRQRDIRELDQNGFFVWGKALGSLHRVCRDIPKHIGILRPSHEGLFESLARDYPSEDETELKEIEHIRRWMKGLDKDKNNYGMIHYDFELDNIIWNNKTPYIIDFDDSIYSWYVADIAYALRDLTDEGEKLNISDTRFCRFIDGYKSECDISNKELEQLPGFYRLHHFISYKIIERSLDLETGEDNPEWMNRLIEKLMRKKNCLYKGFGKN